MTKKILALALAGTTAFSVFGGLNVWAATTPSEKYTTGAYTATSKPAAFPTSGSISTAAGLSTELAKWHIEDASVDLDIKSTEIYLFDYAITSGKDGKFDAAATSMTSDILKKAVTDGDLKIGKDDNVKDAFIAALAFADAVGTAAAQDSEATKVAADLNVIYTEFKAEYDLGGLNSTVESSFKEMATLAADLDKDDYSETYVDATGASGSSVWVEYGLLALQDDVKKAKTSLTTLAPAKNSELIYLYNAYYKIDDAIGLERAKSNEEKYSDLLAEVSGYNSEDYTEDSWTKFEKKLALAELQAEQGDYEDAYNSLKNAKALLKANKPSVADLKSLIESLFVNGNVPTTYTNYNTANAKNTHVYLVANNGNTNPSAAWKAAFGTSTDEQYEDAYGEKHDNAYKVAYTAYRNVTKQANSSKYTQTKIDDITQALEDALAELSEGGSGANWEAVRLEELVEDCQAVVDTDYNTKRTAWKTFETALEKAEATLAKANPSSTELTRVYDNLKKAKDGLSAIKVKAPAARKTDLKDLLDDATKLLKDTDGKTLTQVTALQDAQKEGKKVYSGYASALPSKVESVIADLENAIAGFKQAQGWYKNSAGKWMYGEGDGVYNDGWHKMGASWYYFNADGTAKQNEWFKDTDGEWYWFTNNANAAYGWAKVNGEWYYFKGGCKMVTGWYKVNGGWYYMAPSGKMMTGWVKVNNKWYYLSKESNAYGKMLENTTTPDGYKVGPDGAMI